MANFHSLELILKNPPGVAAALPRNASSQRPLNDDFLHVARAFINLANSAARYWYASLGNSAPCPGVRPGLVLGKGAHGAANLFVLCIQVRKSLLYLQHFNGNGRGLAAAYAQRGNTFFQPPGLQCVEQRDDDADHGVTTHHGVRSCNDVFA